MASTATPKRRAATPPGPGWVYILTNPAMPGLVKIGMTGRNPTTRAAELATATGVPAPFALAWKRAVSDCAAVEASVLRLLEDHRVSNAREFFRCDVAMARQVVEAAAGASLRPWWVSVWHSLFLPKPPTRRPRGGYRRTPGYTGGEIAIYGLLLVAVIGVHVFKPVVPAWVPAGVARSVLAVEHFGQGF